MSCVFVRPFVSVRAAADASAERVATTALRLGVHCASARGMRSTSTPSWSTLRLRLGCTQHRHSALEYVAATPGVRLLEEVHGVGSSTNRDDRRPIVVSCANR